MGIRGIEATRFAIGSPRIPGTVQWLCILAAGDLLPSILTTVGLAIIVFATTNIDDILLLSAFFANRAFRDRAIVIGQFAGIGVLTAASAIAALLSLAVPEGWTGLLGLAPLALGLHSLHSLWSGAAENTEETAPPANSQGSSHSQWVAVALVTIANGGDNLGVYIPLFSRQLTWIPLFAIVFTIMTGAWCMAGYWLVNHPRLGTQVRRYGHVALPFVLIGLGLYILSDARVLLR